MRLKICHSDKRDSQEKMKEFFVQWYSVWTDVVTSMTDWTDRKRTYAVRDSFYWRVVEGCRIHMSKCVRMKREEESNWSIKADDIILLEMEIVFIWLSLEMDCQVSFSTVNDDVVPHNEVPC